MFGVFHAVGDDKSDQLIVLSGPPGALFTVEEDLPEMAFTTHIVGDQASDIQVRQWPGCVRRALVTAYHDMLG